MKTELLEPLWIENAEFLEVLQRCAPNEAKLIGLQTCSLIVGALNHLLWKKGKSSLANSEFENKIIEACYLAARGTDKLEHSGNRQMYWKGRADAASDVRFLKGKI